MKRKNKTGAEEKKQEMMVGLHVFIPKDLKKRVDVKAAEEEQFLNEIVKDLLNDWVRK